MTNWACLDDCSSFRLEGVGISAEPLLDSTHHSFKMADGKLLLTMDSIVSINTALFASNAALSTLSLKVTATSLRSNVSTRTMAGVDALFAGVPPSCAEAVSIYRELFPTRDFMEKTPTTCNPCQGESEEMNQRLVKKII